MIMTQKVNKMYFVPMNEDDDAGDKHELLLSLYLQRHFLHVNLTGFNAPVEMNPAPCFYFDYIKSTKQHLYTAGCFTIMHRQANQNNICSIWLMKTPVRHKKEATTFLGVFDYPVVALEQIVCTNYTYCQSRAKLELLMAFTLCVISRSYRRAMVGSDHCGHGHHPSRIWQYFTFYMELILFIMWTFTNLLKQLELGKFWLYVWQYVF